jgi:hypothetical protein
VVKLDIHWMIPVLWALWPWFGEFVGPHVVRNVEGDMLEKV